MECDLWGSAWTTYTQHLVQETLRSDGLGAVILVILVLLV